MSGEELPYWVTRGRDAIATEQVRLAHERDARRRKECVRYLHRYLPGWECRLTLSRSGDTLHEPESGVDVAIVVDPDHTVHIARTIGRAAGITQGYRLRVSRSRADRESNWNALGNLIYSLAKGETP